MTDPDNKITPDEPEKDTAEQTPIEIAPQLDKPVKKHEVNKLLLAIAIILGTLLIGFLAANVSAVNHAITIINGIISPVIIGFVIAYLCNPILKFYEYVPFKLLQKKHPKLCRGLSIACTILTVFAFLGLVIVLIVPELYHTIKDFIGSLDQKIPAFAKSVCDFLNRFDGVNIDTESVRAEIADFFRRFNESSSDAFNDLVTNYLGYQSTSDFIDAMSGGNMVGKIFDVLRQIINTASSFLVVIKDIFLGTFIAFYILGAKERLYGMTMKCRTAWFSEKTNAKITKTCKLIDQTFGGYIKGTLTDSMLVALETFILFSIFRISQYNLLLAVFIGITNIIPVFGPFIGAIPTGFIVLVTNSDNPIKFWIFVLLIIAIQQIDGNIILPKILGNQTGVSSLCVIIAVTVMGNWLGVLGMVIGVPVFATAIYLIRDSVDERLKKKGRSTDLADYYAKNGVVSGEEDLSHKYNFFIRFVFYIGGVAKKIWRGITRIFRKKKKEESPEDTPKKKKNKKAK